MKKIILIALLFFPGFVLKSITDSVENEEWAVTYKRVFSNEQRKKNGRLKEVIFEQTNLAHFSQIIFSWNAFRPKTGFFSFYIQVRDAKTKKWHGYHKMVDWGRTIQKSYFSKTKGSSFHHARLELNKGQKADGFRIKVITQKTRDLSHVKMLSVVTCDYDLFIPEPRSKQGYKLKTFILKGVPRTSQLILDHPRAEGLCSPTATSMVLGSLQGKRVDAVSVADLSYDAGLGVFGNWSFNTAHAFEKTRGRVLFYVTRLNSFASLYSLLLEKIPVVVSIRGPLRGAPRPYANGHLMVVIGWDAERKRVMCQDPGFNEDKKVLTSYGIHEFVLAWERSRRLVYKPQLVL